MRYPRRMAALAMLGGLALAGCVDSYNAGYYPDAGYGGGIAGGYGYGERRVSSIDDFYRPLSSYGRWDSYGSYGRVWFPTVGRDWRPYTRGRWDSNRRWWSDEPFGWATYHYGRWAYDNRAGWFWVPDTRWGPAWVDWRDAGDYWGWAPRPPYGWGYGSGFGISWVFAPRSYVYQRDLYRRVVPWDAGRWHYDRSRPWNGDWGGRPGWNGGWQRPAPPPPVTRPPQWSERPPRDGPRPRWESERPRLNDDGRPERGERPDGWRGGERPAAGWNGGTPPQGRPAWGQPGNRPEGGRGGRGRPLADAGDGLPPADPVRSSPVAEVAPPRMPVPVQRFDPPAVNGGALGGFGGEAIPRVEAPRYEPPPRAEPARMEPARMEPPRMEMPRAEPSPAAERREMSREQPR